MGPEDSIEDPESLCNLSGPEQSTQAVVQERRFAAQLALSASARSIDAQAAYACPSRV